MGDSLKVVARIRPYLPSKDKVAPVKISVTSDSLTCEGHTFKFDKVFSDKSSNEEVYLNVAHDIVLAAMDGYNGTIFTYGQTSSGKTYTVNYLRSKAIQAIYDYIENCPSREFLLRISYLELYNEKFQDLLTDERKQLTLREDLEKNVYVQNLSEEFIKSCKHFTEVLKTGDERRHFAETVANDCSSRSHCILRVVIESRLADDANLESSGVFVSNLNIVDLAGSEKASENANKDRFNEGCTINKSLLTLSQVIRKLSEEDGFINYRDSKLTRYLRNALGGNSKTAIILTISPTSIDETLSTLKFGQNAKMIKNRPEKNEVVSEKAELKRSLKEIERLKECIRQMGVTQPKEDLEEQKMKKQLMIDELRGLLCVSSKVAKKETKEKNRRQTVCVPQFSRFRPVAMSVDDLPVRVLPPSSIASNVCLSDSGESWTPSKLDQLDLSFKEYEKHFIQDDAFHKILAKMYFLQEENKNLKDQLLNQRAGCLRCTEEPPLVFNESLMAYDAPMVDTYDQDSSFINKLEMQPGMSTNARRLSGMHWPGMSSLDHSCSRAPLVETVAEEEEGQPDLIMEYPTVEKIDMGLKTEINLDEVKPTQEMMLYEQQRLDKMTKQETYLESKIDELNYLEQLKDELEASQYEIQKEKESILQEKRNFAEERQDWEEKVKKSYDELKRQEKDLKNRMNDLEKKEKFLTVEKIDMGLKTENEYSLKLDEVKQTQEMMLYEQQRLDKMRDELAKQETYVESKIDDLNYLEQLKDELEASQYEIQKEKESILQEKRNFAEERQDWEEKVKKSYDELKRQEKDLENRINDLEKKEKSLTVEKIDMGLQTEDEYSLKLDEVKQTQEMMLYEKQRLDKMRDEVAKQETYVESKIDELNYLEQLKDELEASQYELQREKESILQEKRNFAEERQDWEEKVKKFYDELKRQEKDLENRMNDLVKKEKFLTVERIDMGLQTEDEYSLKLDEVKLTQEMMLYEKQRLDKMRDEVAKQETYVESKIDELNYLEQLKDELEASQYELQREKESILQEKRNIAEERQDWEEKVKKFNDELKRQEKDLENRMNDLVKKETSLTVERIDMGLQTEDEYSLKLDEVKLTQEMMLYEQQRLDKLNSDLSVKEEKCQELANQLKHKDELLNGKIDEMVSKEKILDEKLKSLKINEEFLRSKLEVMTEKEQYLECKLQELDVIKAEIIKRDTLAHQSEIDEVKNQKCLVEEQLSALGEELETLKRALEESQKYAQTLEAALEERCQEIDECVEKIDALNNKIEYGKCLLESKDKKLAEHEEIIEKLTREREDLIRQRRSVTQQTSDVASQLEKVNRLLEESQAREERLSEDRRLEAEKARVEMNRLIQQLQLSESHLDEKNKRIDEILNQHKQEIQTLQQDAKSKKEEIITLQMEKSALNKKVACLKESLDKDKQYYCRAIENLKRSHPDNHDGSFLQPKAPEPTEVQIRKKLELEFQIKIKDLEMAYSEMAEQLGKAKAQDVRPSNVLKEKNGCSDQSVGMVKDQDPRLRSLEQVIEEEKVRNSDLLKKYRNLKVKFAKAYDLGFQEATEDCPKCSSMSLGGGAVEGYKLATQERIITKLHRENDKLKEQLKWYTSKDTSGPTTE